MKYIWVEESIILAIHDIQLAEHRGMIGTRDQMLLESTLGRPRHLEAYGENVGVPALAAAYGFGIVRNHPFIDGNKRTAFVITELFIKLNGHILSADNAASVMAIISVTDGSWSEDDFAVWLRKNTKTA